MEVPLPALVVGTQLLGEPRYPTLKGIMGARAKEIAVRTLADLGLADGSVGGAASTTVVVSAAPARRAGRHPRRPRGARRRRPRDRGSARVAEGDLMPGGAWAIAELGPDGLPTRLSTEAATAARLLAVAAGPGAAAVVVAPDPEAAAAALAAHVPRVVAVRLGAGDEASAGTVAEAVAALAAREEPDVVLLGATPDGRTAAGILAARLGRGVLGNAVGVAWSAGDDGSPPGPRVEMSVLGGRAVTVSAFTGGRGIVTLRPAP